MIDLDFKRRELEHRWAVGEALDKHYSDHLKYDIERRQAISLRDVYRHYSRLGVTKETCWEITKMDIQRPLTGHYVLDELRRMAENMTCKQLMALVKGPQGRCSATPQSHKLLSRVRPSNGGGLPNGQIHHAGSMMALGLTVT